MRILNFGSLNLDYVYQVPHFLSPGETMAAVSQQVHPGGKGLNQSIAMARAGASVSHAGLIGQGGGMLRALLQESGVNVDALHSCEALQGNAVIQVTPQGENCILLFGGSNQEVAPEDVPALMGDFGPGDLLVVQNEVSSLPVMLREARARGMQVALNPSPFDAEMLSLDYSAVTWLFINEVEGAQMTGSTAPEAILAELRRRHPAMNAVLTLGRAGAYADTPAERCFQPAFPVHAVDTTAAGDTFTGYFLAALTEGLPMSACMRLAAAAAAISVSRPGASASIPRRDEVDAWLRAHQ